ncbi:TRAP transporter small permease [Gymnodinialimonas sp. 2305UL16-5]|uniref:TRAP transporter small permease n=1 Tax=Gymnodinialimonas mytili TaxID=3126503 RepID=UPI00309E28E6
MTNFQGKTMSLIRRAIDGLSTIAFVFAGAILVYAVCHILLEIVLRSVFATSTHVLDEFIGFAILSITFLSLAATLRDGAMIKVNLLVSVLPMNVQRWLDAATSLIAALLVIAALRYFFRNLAKDWERGTVSESVAQVPLWIPGTIVCIGAALLALQLLLRTVLAARGELLDEATDAGGH